MVKRNRLNHPGLDGRYWARTSTDWDVQQLEASLLQTFATEADEE
jgi:hypothetical protein